MIVELNLRGTLELATALQPDVRQVFVISGAESVNRLYESLARAQFRSLEPRLAFTYLSGLPTKALEARLASLPEHSIVYYLVVDRDGAHRNFDPLEYLDRLAAVANAPIYCWVDSAMDHGIVGGSLKDQVAQMEVIGALAVRILNGERADRIPVSTPDLNVKQVDWRQLRRWRISEARVPAGTLVRFREPSVWDRYQVYILDWSRGSAGAGGVDCGTAGAARETTTCRAAAAGQSGTSCVAVTIGSAIWAGVCSTRRKGSGRALRGSCTTTSARRWPS